jgi:Family of unknown function (DUF6800)
MSHIERKSELKRRRHRRAKIKKLRAKLAKAKNPHEAQLVTQRIKKISPFWHLPGEAPAPAKPAARPAARK